MSLPDYTKEQILDIVTRHEDLQSRYDLLMENRDAAVDALAGAIDDLEAVGATQCAHRRGLTLESVRQLDTCEASNG